MKLSFRKHLVSSKFSCYFTENDFKMKSVKDSDYRLFEHLDLFSTGKNTF
jgi:hypothetical protein